MFYKECKIKCVDSVYVYKEYLSDAIAGLTPVSYCLQVMSDHKANETSYQEKLNAESGHSRSVEEEKELLREQIVDLRKVNHCAVIIL